jgi:hypothetical protein
MGLSCLQMDFQGQPKGAYRVQAERTHQLKDFGLLFFVYQATVVY